MRKLLCAIALSTVALLGADITGRWSGTIEFNRNGEVRNDKALLIFKQEGTKVTGSIGPNEDQRHPISTGTVENGRVTLEVTPESGHPAKVVVSLKLDGDDHMTGDFKAETDEGTMAGKLDVKRDK